MNGKEMRVLEINSSNFGSTGKIMLGIADVANAEGFEIILCCPYSRSNAIYQDRRQVFIGNRLINNIHLLLGYLTGMSGMFSIWSTYRLLRKIRRTSPDIIHLHNLHNCYINLPMLFGFIKKYKIKIVWTLHDCWAFTGHCSHYTISECMKWKIKCEKCPSYKLYPPSIRDNAKFMYEKKKKWFLNVKDMILVVPSIWLRKQVKKSFLKEYTCKLIYNGINTDLFRYTESDLKKNHEINKKIILGVSSVWNYAKGLDVFIKIAESTEEYTVVIVGTDDKIDRQLPKNVVSIHRTRDVKELASIYSAADVFLNPTREEVLGLVNIEALACGTPVVTFDSGGSPECIDESCGVVVSSNIGVYELINTIGTVIADPNITKEKCRERALKFEEKMKYCEYVDIYKKVIEAK